MQKTLSSVLVFNLDTGRPWPEGSQDSEKAGQPIAGGYFLATLSITGDIEFHSEGYKLRHHASSQPCSKCKANDMLEGLPWPDCKESARWRAHIWDRDSWLDTHGDAIHLFKLSTCSIEQLHFDLMHTKSLGTDQAMLGSWLQFMTTHKKVALSDLWALIKNKYKETRN